MIGRLFQGIARAFAPVTSSVHWSPDWAAAAHRNPWGSLLSGSGLTALSGVHASVTKITGGLTGADIHVARFLATGGVAKDTASDAAAVLAATPLAELQPLVNDWLTHGNAYAEVADGVLTHIPYRRATLVRETGTERLHLKVTARWPDATKERHLAPGEYLHLKMLPSDDEDLGQSPLDRLRPGLSMAYSVIDTAQQIVSQSAKPGAILVAPNGLKAETRERLRTDFAKAFSQAHGGAGRTAILDFDARLERVPSAEQMISEALVALAEFGVAEVARAYGVPLSLLAQTSDTNRSTAAEEARQFSIFCVSPLARQLADALTHFLISPEDRARGLRVRVDLTDALIGHGIERADYASKLVNGGICSRNEMRNLIGLPDIEGGEQIACPANTVPLDQWLEAPQPAQEPPVAAPIDPTRTYTPPAQPALPAASVGVQATEAEVVDFKVALAEARLRAAVAGPAFNAHCAALVAKNEGSRR